MNEVSINDGAQVTERKEVRTPQTYIALFEKLPEGYGRVGHDFVLSDFGGVLPDVGDIIVPYFKNVLDATDYKVYKVDRRYFRPADGPHQFINVGLVVSEREGEKEEQLLIVGAS